MNMQKYYQNDELLCNGYMRPDGRKGIRNKLLLIYTVECSKQICFRIADSFRPGNDLECVGNESCAYNESLHRQLCALICHPNTGAVLIVGMGCECLEPEGLYDFALKAGVPSRMLIIQKCGGTIGSLNRGKELVSELLKELFIATRVPMYRYELCIGVECGSSDYSSHISANPLIGELLDRHIACGGYAVAGEITEMVGQKQRLVSRAADAEARAQITITYEKMLRFCKATGRYSISVGNLEGGLTTIEEKSAGALTKTGTAKICGVIKLAQQIPSSGLWILDELPDFTPGFECILGGDATSMLNLISSGCHLVLFSTGRGQIVGSPVGPVLKVSGNRRTCALMSGDIDFDASGILRGEKSLESAVDNLWSLVMRISCGMKSCAEQQGNYWAGINFNSQMYNSVIEKLCY